MADLDAVVRLSSRVDPSLRRGFQDAEGSVSRLDRRLDGLGIPPRLAGAARAAGRGIRGLGESAGLTRRRLRGTTEQLRGLNRELGRTERRAGRFGRGGILGGAGLLAGVAGIAGARRLLEQSINQAGAEIRLRTVVVTEGDRADAARRLREDAQALARSRQAALATEAELVEAFYQASSAGLEEQLARDAGVVSHRVARVTSGNIEQVTATIARSLSLFGDQLGVPIRQRAEAIGDVLAAVQQAEQISNFDALGAGLEKALGAAAAARLPLRDVVAYVGRLNSLGVLGPEAGTALSTLLGELPRASGEIGFAIVRANDGSLDLLATLENIRRKLHGLDPDAAILRLQKGFGQEVVRTLGLFTENIDTIPPALERVRQDLGLVRRDYGEMADDVSGKSEIAKQGIADIADSLGTALLPAVSAVAGPLGEYSSSLAEIIDRSPLAQDAVKGITGSALGLAGVLAVSKLAAISGAPGLLIGIAGAAGYTLGGYLERETAVGRIRPDAEREFERLARETQGALVREARPSVLVPGAEDVRRRLDPARIPLVEPERLPRFFREEVRTRPEFPEDRRGLPADIFGRSGDVVFESGAIQVSGADDPGGVADEVIRRIEDRARRRSSAAEYDER